MNAYGLERVVDYISNAIKQGRFTVDGKQVTVPANVVQDETKFRVILYLPAEDNAQTVTKIEIIDDRGVVIDSKTGVVEKPARKGLWEAFEYTWVSEVN